MSQPIEFWNRETGRMETEEVFGERWIKLAYRSAPGLWLTRRLLTQPWISRAYGWLQSQPFSARKIDTFVNRYKIDMEQFEDVPFHSFNDFFIRPFKPGRRPFASDHALPAFAEGRYFVFQDIQDDTLLPIKGTNIDPLHLLDDTGMAQHFLGGSCVIARLCPVDYHRFHFPDAGVILQEKKINGVLHSVNPIALEAEEEVFLRNERFVTLIDSEKFGKVAYVEVGALCVGKIVQTYAPEGKRVGSRVVRGQEKGYFLFGGSTVVALFQKGRIQFDEDVLLRSREAIETYLKLGTRFGTLKS